MFYIPKNNEYNMMYGKIMNTNSFTMARCACVACNSCTCACSCRVISIPSLLDF